MVRTTLGWIGIILIGGGCLHAANQEASSVTPPPAASSRAILNRYCITCHNEKLKTAGLMLDKVDLGNVAPGAEIWEKVVRKLQTRAMPPAAAPRPDEAAYKSLASYLETALDDAVVANPNPGRPAVQRLNRAEYVNAVRDLLAIDTAAVDIQALLPADDSGYGFDNIGDVLSVSPLLLERYIAAARKVSRLAVGNPETRIDSQTYEISKFMVQEDRMSEELPFGSRGGIAVQHFFPVDGEYVIKARLKTTYDGATILGLAEQHQFDFYLEGTRIKTFVVGGKKTNSPNAPQPDQQRDEPPNDLRPADADLEVRVAAKAGVSVVGVAFVKKAYEPETMFQPHLVNRENDEPAVSGVIISGPYDSKGVGDTPSRRRIFVCHPTAGAPDSPDAEQCAAKILATIARRAFRRPITDQDVHHLLEGYRAARKDASFEARIELALRRILLSPEFLFRVVRDPENIAPSVPYRISDLDLASRLSFFLWSSIPDDQLLDLAEHGKLQDPVALEQQVRRMLADSRSKSLIDNFAGQWLHLRNVRTASPDLGEYPDFNENLREAFTQETKLFLESMLREDRSVIALLAANYTFLNERLARHYGIPGVYGSHFRRVTLENENRWGLLGQGSILMVTSYANRTSPTIRGKWLLENLLGAPPPPPPPEHSVSEGSQ